METGDTNKARALKNHLPARRDMGDPEDVKERDDIRKLIAQQEGNDLRELLALPAGRRFIWRLLNECRIFGMSFNPENQYLTAHLEGKRAVGMWVTREAEAVSKEGFLTMWAENFGEKT